MWINKNKFESLESQVNALQENNRKLTDLNYKLNFLVETIYGEGVTIEQELSYGPLTIHRELKLIKKTEAKKEEIKHLSQKKSKTP